MLGVSASDSRTLTKAVPTRPDITIKQALLESVDLQNLIKHNPLYQRVVSIAQKIEGLPRQTGCHACGIIISKDPVTSYCPLAVVHDDKTGEAVVTTQWTGPECEEVGLVKFDFLGLRTLDVIDNSLELINQRNGTNYEQNTVPINDIKTYKHLLEGNTSGVFQFESDGMTSLLKKMFIDVGENDTPEKGEEYFERLIAAVSLYRPGPMDEIPNYLKAMHSGNVVYDHPMLESILGSTYGVLVYQEEIMFAVRKLAGFTAGQSDTVRKAMGKKKKEIMTEYGEYFIYGSEKYDKAHPESPKNIKGCIKNGVPEATARLIWDKMVKFAEYAFNKSHATCYAGLGAITAWLSCYYPVEFMTGVLNSYLGTNEKIAKYSSDCANLGIKVYSPDINRSGRNFTVIDNGDEKAILFGLAGIKEVGSVAADAIIEERQNGEFKNLADFLVRMADYKFTKRALLALTYSGALDCFGYNRASLVAANTDMLDLIKRVKKKNKNQLDIFDMIEIEEYSLEIKERPDFDNFAKSIHEKEYLGYFLHHPMDEYSDKITRWKQKGMITSIEELIKVLEENNDGSDVRIAGLVSEKESLSYTDKRTKKPKQMIKFIIDDGTATIKCAMFNDEAVKFSSQFADGSVVYILGKGSLDDFGPQCRISNLYVFAEEDRNIRES